MNLQTPSRKGASFDEIYAKVPAEQVERLKEFRSTHKYKQLSVDGVEWEYISCGRGEHTLLLHPGGLSVGESTFHFIMAFEKEYRIIAPSYALSQKMAGLCEGIAHIMETEGVNHAHLFGGSYGGLVAQYFVRMYPDKVCSLILSHTSLMTPKFKKPLQIANKLSPILPRGLFVPLLKLRLNKILLSTLRAAKHPEFEFWRAYLNEAIISAHLQEVAIHQNHCLLDLVRQPQFTPEDLKGWQGNIMIIDSDDDPAISTKDRNLLRNTYSQALVHTFHGVGHASSILKREDIFSIIRNFLSELNTR